MLVALTYASTPISKTLFIDLGLVNVSKVVTSDFVNIHNPGRLLLSNGYILDLKTFSGSVDVFWDETDTNGQVSFAVGASVTLAVYPEGATSGDTYYSGTAIVTGRTITSSFDGMVEASFTLQGSGALTAATV